MDSLSAQDTVDPLGSTKPHFQTAAEYAYQYVRGLILSGELPGGTRLSQDDLATRLQISRMPVRQAVLRLENEGLVVNRPNRGAVVTTLGPAAMLELFEMRGVLEGLALSLALPNIDARAVAKIEVSLDALERAKVNVGRWIQMHDDFHNMLCTYARRPRLTAYVRRLRQSVVPYLRLYLTTSKLAEIPGAEHRGLIDAIKTGDCEHAERTMREHVMSAGHGVVEFVRAQEEGQRAESAKEN